MDSKPLKVRQGEFEMRAFTLPTSAALRVTITHLPTGERKMDSAISIEKLRTVEDWAKQLRDVVKAVADSDPVKTTPAYILRQFPVMADRMARIHQDANKAKGMAVKVITD